MPINIETSGERRSGASEEIRFSRSGERCFVVTGVPGTVPHPATAAGCRPAPPGDAAGAAFSAAAAFLASHIASGAMTI